MNPLTRTGLPHLNRRTFLGLGAAATGAVLLGGCGAADGEAASSAAPRDGGRLRAVFAGEERRRRSTRTRPTSTPMSPVRTPCTTSSSSTGTTSVRCRGSP
ncbi:twin-arginine translocation signal domain-containing protein [Rhodococcus sp. MTM3W5.2]|uniref:twin-arginine translocation signal domain-containing protein n=1 Tax=Rhodococcus sp. MTM3W5.2 TaxID=1805827 RepID=UPI001CB90CA9|nr:twin-arginine translocation signal domain-containing protein [Rhodococcus sp. MTM3W5.2]